MLANKVSPPPDSGVRVSRRMLPFGGLASHYTVSYEDCTTGLPITWLSIDSESTTVWPGGIPPLHVTLDTAGLATTMGALALYTASSFSLADLITALKIILIFVFVFITSPTATHAIIDAGVRAGLAPWRKEPEGNQ